MTTPLRRLRVAQVVVTDEFAGVERYVSQVAAALSDRGHDVIVVGGADAPMRRALPAAVHWVPGSTVPRAAAALLGKRPVDVIHVHMTKAELAALPAHWLRRTPIVATRHFARARGSTRGGRAFARLVPHAIDREIATSEYVAANLESVPSEVIHPGVRASDEPYDVSSRLVLMVQRLEPEKETLTGLRIWEASRLGDEGWLIRIVGDGSQRASLERWVNARGLAKGVQFTGWSADVPGHLREAALLLAPTSVEALGLSVIEAMAQGVPVVASSSGGHLETVGRVDPGVLFAPGDVAGGAELLRGLAHNVDKRRYLSRSGRRIQRDGFSVQRHVEGLERTYLAVAGRHRAATQCG